MFLFVYRTASLIGLLDTDSSNCFTKVDTEAEEEERARLGGLGVRVTLGIL